MIVEEEGGLMERRREGIAPPPPISLLPFVLSMDERERGEGDSFYLM